MSPQEAASQLVAHSGGVGDTSVQPFYPGVGAVVQPHYPGVGAPAVAVPGMPAERPIQYGQEQYTAGDVSYLGLGVTTIAAGATEQIQLNPFRPFSPQMLYFPSTVQSLLVKNVSIGGVKLFANDAGFPVEMLSEVSNVPQILWPTITPAVGVSFEVENPTPGPLDFRGFFYGTQVRI